MSSEPRDGRLVVDMAIIKIVLQPPVGCETAGHLLFFLERERERELGRDSFSHQNMPSDDN